jgi:AcrR family transcriptional regulator
MDLRAELGEETRLRLLRATADVVAELGGPGLTMQAVADRAGLALRTVYNYFPSKEALVLAAYDRLANETIDAAKRVPPTGSARADLLQFVETYLASYETQQHSRALVGGVPGIPELEERVRQVRQWRRQELERLLRAARREDPLRVNLPQGVALGFVATAYATWEVLVAQVGLSPSSARRLLVDTLDAALFGPP